MIHMQHIQEHNGTCSGLPFSFNTLIVTIVVMLLLFLFYNYGSKMMFDDSDDFSTLFDGAGIHKMVGV